MAAAAGRARPRLRHDAGCEQAGPGQPVHNPLNAWRAKTRPGEAPQEDSQAGRAPVAEAVKTAGSALNRAEQLAAALRETGEQLTGGGSLARRSPSGTSRSA